MRVNAVGHEEDMIMSIKELSHSNCPKRALLSHSQTPDEEKTLADLQKEGISPAK